MTPDDHGYYPEGETVDLGVYLADLLEDGHTAEAEDLLRQVLEYDPENSGARALRAMCLDELGEADEALIQARTAVANEADNPYANWVLGILLAEKNQLDDATTAAGRAVELDPDEPDHHALLAAIAVRRRKWTDAIAHADAGLAIDPGHDTCLHLRSVVQGFQGGKVEDWEAALSELNDMFPASDMARTGRGWAALERGRAVEAREHFEQALALDPTSEWARHGYIEARKAQNPVYARLIRFFLWFGRQPARTRWGIILGGMFGYRVLRNAAETTPQLGPFVYPLMAVWVLFILLSWIGEPLSDFILSLDREGRRFLTRGRRIAANWMAGAIGVALVLVALGAATGAERWWFGAMAAGVFVIPLGAVFQCPRGWPRTTMTIYAGVVGLLVVMTLLASEGTAPEWMIAALLMSAAGSWLGVFLASRIPKG